LEAKISRQVIAPGEHRLVISASEGLPSLYFVEWHYIDYVLSCVGNISQAARVLGVRRSTVQRRRKKHRPDR
jgi:ActR/RegA family two-component response regulator